jgi:hypothetical protein
VNRRLRGADEPGATADIDRAIGSADLRSRRCSLANWSPVSRGRRRLNGRIFELGRYHEAIGPQLRILPSRQEFSAYGTPCAARSAIQRSRLCDFINCRAGWTFNVRDLHGIRTLDFARAMPDQCDASRADSAIFSKVGAPSSLTTVDRLRPPAIGAPTTSTFVDVGRWVRPEIADARLNRR